MDFLDGWTLVPWVAGLVWLLGGFRLLRWAWPAVVFLALLTPLPYQAESLLSFKLQGVATQLSTMALQTMGFVAVPEGNTIWIGDHQLMVEEACSGLRILVGMMAMGFFFMILSDRCWIDRLVIIACCIPIAIAVNVLRVIGTGLAYYWLDAAWAHQIHDLLGVLMIVAGSAMFLGVKSYWEHLYRPLQVAMLQKNLVLQQQS
jgi:exosortase